MEHNLQELQYTHTRKPRQVQDHWWTHTREPQDMACIDSEQGMKPHQHNQKHPHIELTEMEQMREQVCLLEHQVQQQNAQWEKHQGEQTVTGHWTNVDQLLVQPVKQDITVEQHRQHPLIPTEQRGLLDFFISTSHRPPPCPQHTSDDDYDDEESRSGQLEEESSNRMQQQHPVETILHSKIESNGQEKYLIRWSGNIKDSWQPKGNITSDVIDNLNKRRKKKWRTSIWQWYKWNLLIPLPFFIIHVTSV